MQKRSAGALTLVPERRGSRRPVVHAPALRIRACPRHLRASVHPGEEASRALCPELGSQVPGLTDREPTTHSPRPVSSGEIHSGTAFAERPGMNDSQALAPSPSPLAGMGKDLRVAVRRLLKDRGFTATAVLTLALATGATTAVFTLVNAVLLRPLAYRAPEQLVRIYDVQPDVARASVSVPDAHDWITRSRSLSGLALFAQTNKSLSGDGEPLRVSTQRMSAGALRVLGLPPLLGREFSEDEDRVGGPAVAMLGERFWRKQYAGRPDIVGTTVRLDGIDHTVLGVVREQPHWLADSDVWVPLQNDPATLPRGMHFMNAIGRLAPGVTVASAERDLLSVVKEIGREEPEYQYHGILVVPWVDELLGEARTSLGALGAVVGLVLLIACVNLANLLLARGPRGAVRWRSGWRSAPIAGGWRGRSSPRRQCSRCSAPRSASSWAGWAPRCSAARCPSARRPWRTAWGSTRGCWPFGGPVRAHHRAVRRAALAPARPR